MSRVVLISLPLKHPGRSPKKCSVIKFDIARDCPSIYETVDIAKAHRFSDGSTTDVLPPCRTLLRDVVNLHNRDGIKDTDQILSMAKEIHLGRDILEDATFPNIKVVVTKRKETVLFDGHHTVLAYMMTGKTFLGELPYLRVTNQGKEYVNDRDFLDFFGDHRKKISAASWRGYTINWQARFEMQLRGRSQRNVGELFDVTDF